MTQALRADVAAMLMRMFELAEGLGRATCFLRVPSQWRIKVWPPPDVRHAGVERAQRSGRPEVAPLASRPGEPVRDKPERGRVDAEAQVRTANFYIRV
jgi:hypothetical protein